MVVVFIFLFSKYHGSAFESKRVEYLAETQRIYNYFKFFKVAAAYTSIYRVQPRRYLLKCTKYIPRIPFHLQMIFNICQNNFSLTLLACNFIENSFYSTECTFTISFSSREKFFKKKNENTMFYDIPDSQVYTIVSMHSKPLKTELYVYVTLTVILKINF